MSRSRLLLVATIFGALATSMPSAADQEGPRNRPAAADAMQHLHLIRPPLPTPAPDFKATLGDGKTFQLSAQRGKVAFINFWATWCLPCRAEMPMMEKLWRRHRAHSFVMLAVSTDSAPSEVPPFIAQQGFTFPVTLDPTQDLARAYGLRGLPMSVIVDPTGNVAALAIGPRDWGGAAANALVEELTR